MKRKLTHEVSSGTVVKRKKLKDDSELRPLHDLLLSEEPNKYQSALSIIAEKEINLNDFQIKEYDLLFLAVENRFFSVIKALLKNMNIGNIYHAQFTSVLAAVMRSLCISEILSLFSQYCKLDFAESCKYLHWDMSEEHIEAAIKTLLKVTGHTIESAIQNIFQSSLSRKFEFVKLLFRCKDEENERSIDFRILLDDSNVVKDSVVVAFLIREGASFNDCINENQQYPLHIACESHALKTVKILLELGADVNITDRLGSTPFSILSSKSDNPDYLPVARLMIKHFVFCFAMGYEINQKNLMVLLSEPNLKEFYESCIEELHKMKVIEAADGFPYYWFFSKTNYKLSLLLRDTNVFYDLRKNLLHLKPEVFPNFKDYIFTKFRIARQMCNIMVSKERKLEEFFSGILPCLVVRKIARYSVSLKNIEKDYFLKKNSM